MRTVARAISAFLLAMVGAAALGAAVPTPLRAEEAVVGIVKTLSGTATVKRDGNMFQLQIGTTLHEQDLIETGPDGQLGITFRDNSRIAIGPGTRLAVSRFTFRPDQRQYGFIVQLLHGTLEYISGLTAKLSPDSVSIEMPTSTIAVRGTRLLARAE